MQQFTVRNLLLYHIPYTWQFTGTDTTLLEYITIQRMSVAMQRGNAASVAGTTGQFPALPDDL